MCPVDGQGLVFISRRGHNRWHGHNRRVVDSRDVHRDGQFVGTHVTDTRTRRPAKIRHGYYHRIRANVVTHAGVGERGQGGVCHLQ